MIFQSIKKLALVAAGLVLFAGVHAQTVDPMVDPVTGKPYPRGTAVYVPFTPGTIPAPGTDSGNGDPSTRMTQADVNSYTDPISRAASQWNIDEGAKWKTQADGIERITDVDSLGRQRIRFTWQKSTAADCLIGRHWELVGSYAGCVCDGDLTHTRVSNDKPNACVVVAPPVVVTPPTIPSTPTGGGSILAGFTFGGLGSPTGNATPLSSNLSGTWVVVSGDCCSATIQYTVPIGSSSFGGTCVFSVSDSGAGYYDLGGGCGNGTAYASGLVVINIANQYFSGQFIGSNLSNGTVTATGNPGTYLFDVVQGGQQKGVIFMDGSGNFSGVGGTGISGYINGSGIGAISVNGNYFAAMTGTGIFGTYTNFNAGIQYAIGGTTGDFFMVNSGGGIVGTGSVSSIATNDPGWQTYFVQNNLPVPSGFNSLLSTAFNGGLFYAGTPYPRGDQFFGPAGSRIAVTSP